MDASGLAMALEMDLRVKEEDAGGGGLYRKLYT